MIQWFPANGGIAKSFSISYLTRRWVLAAGLIILVVVAMGFLSLVSRAGAAREMAQLRQTNGLLAAELEIVDDLNRGLVREMDNLTLVEQRFRVAAGLPVLSDDMYAVGIGGAGTVKAADSDVHALLRRARLLTASLSESSRTLEENRLAHVDLPIIYPAAHPSSWISSGYSNDRMHPTLNIRQPHRAVDIVAPPGSSVWATGGGRVVFAGRRGTMGNFVEIDHGNGWISRYGHLDRILVGHGQEVNRWDPVGTIGNTGRTTGYHLHYEIEQDGIARNPALFFYDDEY